MSRSSAPGYESETFAHWQFRYKRTVDSLHRARLRLFPEFVLHMWLFVQTLNFAEGAIGLGVDELRWPNAVRPGDALKVETEILELRLSRSKPNYGIIRLRNVTTNQRSEIVQTMTANAMVPRRKVSD